MTRIFACGGPDHNALKKKKRTLLGSFCLFWIGDSRLTREEMRGDTWQMSSGSGVQPVMPPGCTGPTVCTQPHSHSAPQSNPWCWAPSREELGPIFIVFGMTRPGIEPQPSSLRVDALATELVNFDLWSCHYKRPHHWCKRWKHWFQSDPTSVQTHWTRPSLLRV